jgi:2,3-bisphosphoglycerate-dependent phosphoglycerate mutase
VPSHPPLSRPSELWLVRHAESGGNLADDRAREEGASRLTLTHRDPDMPLSEQGVSQAKALGEWWRDLSPERRPDVVLTSPYARAQETARAACIAARWDVPLVRDERLRERDLGVLDGWTKVGIERQFPDEAARRDWLGKFYYRPPGGESWADVAGRVRQLLTALVVDPRHDRVAVFSHQAVIMLFRYVLEDLTEPQVLAIDAHATLANTGVTCYRREDAGLRLVSFNETTHLQGTAEVTHEPDSRASGR